LCQSEYICHKIQKKWAVYQPTVTAPAVSKAQAAAYALRHLRCPIPATQGASENVPLVLLAGATGPHNKNNIAVKPYILTEIQKFSCYVWALHLKSNTGHDSMSGLGESAAAAAPQLAQMRLMRRRAAGLPVVALSGPAPGAG